MSKLTNDVYFNPEEINKIINNIEAYSKNEEILIDNFVKQFDNILNYYKTSNTAISDNLFNNLVINMKRIKKNFDNDYYALNKISQKYQILNEDVTRLFNNIDK